MNIHALNTTQGEPQPAGAALAEAAPTSPTTAPTPEAPAPRFEIEGRVNRPAELRVSPGGGYAHLIVTLAQPKRNGRLDPPITATYSATADELPAMEALSWRLLPGTTARLIGYGMDFNADRKALKLNNCLSIRELRAGGEVGLSVGRRGAA